MYAHKDQEARRSEDRPPPAGSRSCENLSIEQLEFPTFEAKFPGATHHIMLSVPQAVIDAVNQVLAEVRKIELRHSHSIDFAPLGHLA